MKEVKELIQKGVTPFKTLKKRYGHAHYTFIGELNDEFIARLGRLPTEAEVAAMVDNFSYNFGWECDLHNKIFGGRIEVD